MQPAIEQISSTITNLYKSFLPPDDSSEKKFLYWLQKEEYGQNLYSRYALSLFQIHENNTENIRLANQMSTRMSTVQQTIYEHNTTINQLYINLRELSKMNDKILEINHQINDIHRFCLQTEIAMLSLEETIKKASI